MKTFFVVCFVTACLFSTSSGKDIPPFPDDREILEKIRQAVQGIEALAGAFTEEKRLVLFKEPVVLSGLFYYLKPDRLRWEYRTPEQQGFAVSKEKGVQWRGDDPRAIPFNVHSTPAVMRFVEQVLLWIRGDFSRIQERYRISVPTKDPVAVMLIPLSKAEKALIDRILIVFSTDLRHVRTVDIHEADGDASRIRFTRIRINPFIDPALFP